MSSLYLTAMQALPTQLTELSQSRPGCGDWTRSPLRMAGPKPLIDQRWQAYRQRWLKSCWGLPVGYLALSSVWKSAVAVSLLVKLFNPKIPSVEVIASTELTA